MATLVGKVGIVMKGTWNSAATYEALDAVSYSSGFYIAKQYVPANTAPTNTTYWQEAITGVGLRTYLQTNGGGGSLVNATGFYFVTVKHSTDETAYYFGLVYKRNGGAPTIVLENHNKITVNAMNEGGTMQFYYDGAAATTALTASSYKLN